jgi:hypothetical protein
MAILTVGVGGTYASILAALAVAQPGDTIDLLGGYNTETVTVGIDNLTFNGAAASTGIVLNLDAGVGTITLQGASPIVVNDNAASGTIINANAGDNHIQVTGGADSVTMGAGSGDRLIVNWAALEGLAIPQNVVGGGTHFDGGAGYFVDFSGAEHFTVTTGSGNDNLFTNNWVNGNDEFYTGSGDDQITAGTGTVIVDGGTGTDSLSADISAYGAVSINLQTGAYSGASQVSITGIEQLSGLTTGSGNDVIVTRTDLLNDIVATGGGDDTVTVAGGGNDSVTMGEQGAVGDRLIVNWAALGVGQNAVGGGTNFNVSGASYFVSYSGVEHFTVTTGAGDDNLITSGWVNSNDEFHTGSGNDQITAGTGTLIVDGGSGTDSLSADISAYGAVSINLQTGAYSGTSQVSITGIEHFSTSSGNGLITGTGQDVIVTRTDLLNDVVTTGDNDDTVTVAGGSDSVTMEGGTGDRLIVNWAALGVGQNAVGGGSNFNVSGASYFVSYSGVEHFTVTTGAGDDNLFTSGWVNSNDEFHTGAGNDQITAGTGTLIADGGSGEDGLSADISAYGAVNINLQTGAYSGTTDVSITGIEYFTSSGGGLTTGSGDDVIVTRTDSLNDTVSTGDGDDTVTVAGGGNDSVIMGAHGAIGDRLIVSWAALGVGQNAVGGGSNFNVSGASYFVSYSGVEHFTVTTGAGNDNLFTNSWTGNDVINVGLGDNTVTTGSGDDLLIADYAALSTAFTLAAPTADAGGYTGSLTDGIVTNRVNFAGIDRFDITTGSGNDSIATGGGNDVFNTGAGGDTIDGNGGVDTVSYATSAAGVIVDLDAGTAAGGDAAGDTLSDIENLVGGAQADRFTGSTANNTLTGGGARDHFSFLAGFGDDVVTDFNAANETLHFSAGVFANVAAALAAKSQSGVDTLFDDGFGNTLTLLNVNASSVTAANIDIIAVNDAPLATHLTQSKGYIEDDASVALDDIVVSDVDESPVQIITATLTLSNAAAGVLTTSGGGSFNAGVWTITDTIANVNAALAAVSFTPSADNDVNVTITTHIQDQDAAGPADGTIALNVTPVNDAPVASHLTQVQDYGEDDASVALDDIVVSEVDTNPAQTITATLTLSNTATGVLTTSGAATYNAGVWSITDTIANVNAALAAVSFTPAADNDAYATITTHIQDQNTAGPANGTISLNVIEINDAPTAVDDALAAVTEDSGVRTITFAALTGNDSKGPSQESGQALTITNVTNAVGGSVAIVSGHVEFTPDADFNGAASFDYVVEDDGTTDGSADPLSDTGHVTFTVTEVNDAPVATDDALSVVAEDSGLRTISVASLLGNDGKGPANESGQSLTITAVSNAIGGSVAIVSGQIEFTPDANHNGAASFDYTVQDNGTTNGSADPLTDTGHASFTVTEVNDAPAATDDALSSSAEDSGVRTIAFAALTGNDSKGPANESGQALTIANVTNAVGGSVAIVSGHVEFTPDADFNGAASFDYTVQDNGTTNGSADPLTDTGHVTFAVTEVNDAPTAADDSLSDIAEDSGARIITFASLTGNDSKGPANESGQGLTITAVSNAIGGSVAIVSGQIEFSPDADFNGAASFDYTIQDNGTTNGSADPLAAAGHASFTVTEVNDAPTATDDALSSVAEDSVVRTISFASLLGNDGKGPANESGQSLTITAVSNAVGGSVAIVSGQIEFTPDANHNGAASFDYTVQDNGTTNGSADPLIDTGHVTFAVTEVNDAPTATDDSLSSSAEDSGVRAIAFAALTGNDGKGPANESGQSLTIAAVSNAVGGSVAIVSGHVEFTPDADFNGAASFDYTVQDNGTTDGAADPLIDTGHVSFTVTEVNDAPTATDDALSSSTEDSGMRAISFASLLGNDGKGPANESGQSLTITAVSNAIGGSVAIVSGQVEFTPDANFNGAASFGYTVQDNGTTNGSADLLTDTGHVTFAVTEVNDAPTATDDALSSSAEDSGVRTIAFAALTGNDGRGPSNESGQALTITNVTNVIGGSVAIVSGHVEFTPDADFNGAASFGYTVQDNGTTNGSADLLTDTGHVTFAVTEVNDAPAATDDLLSSSAEDSGVRTIAFAALTGNDGKGPANESGQALTITNVTNVIGGSVAIVSGHVEFTPDADFNGAASFDYTVQDNGTTNGSDDSLTDIGHASFTVTEVNDAPVATDDTLSSVTEDSSVRIVTFASLTGNDSKGPANESGQSLTITAVSNAIGGSVAIVSGQIEFTPDADFNGTASFDYTVQDNGTTNGSGDPLTDTGQVSFAVTEINDAPTATDDALSSIAEDSGVRAIAFAALTGNDGKGPPNESGQSLTITNVTNAVGGSVAIVSGQIEFTPDANYNGAASFDYTVQDNGTTDGAGDSLTDTGHVTFSVTEVNDAPAATDDALSNSTEDSGVRTISFASLLGNDGKGPANESGQSLAITGVSNAIGGSVAIVSGQIEFTPDADHNGTASFDYTVQDDGTTNGSADPRTDTGHASFAVTEVNDAPAATDDTLSSIAEDSGARIMTFASLTGNDSKGPSNESGQSLTITSVTNAIGGSVTIVSGHVEFTPDADFNGAASFDYTVQDDGTTDGSGDPLTDTGHAAFAVTEVNDAPTATDDALSSTTEDAGVRAITFASLLGNDGKGPADESGQSLTITAVSNAVGGSVAIVSGQIEFTPDANFNGAASFDYIVQDNGTTNGSGDSRTDIGHVTFSVTEINDAPVAIDDALSSVAEDSGVRVITFASLTGNDGKGASNESTQSLTITAASNAVGGSVAIVSGQIEFTPDTDFNGTASFDYTVQDNGTTNGSADPLTDTGQASFAVTEINDAPTTTDDSLLSSAEDSGVRIITFASLTGNDGKGPANESGQSLTITAVSNAIGGSVAIVSGQIAFTPDADFHGAASFDYTVQDDGTTNGLADPLTDSGHAAFTVTEVNDAPTATDDALSSVAEDSGVRTISFASLLGNDSKGPADESGQSLTVTAVSNAVGGSVAIVSGQIEFTPDANFDGAASFDYTVQDDGTTNGSADPRTGTGHVWFAVTEINDAATAVDDALAAVAEDSGVRTIAFAALTGNDSKGPSQESGQALTVTSVTNAIGGSVAIVSGHVEFTPDANHNGAASFDYTVQDDGTTNGSADPLTDTGHVTFAVTEVNDAPTATDDALSSTAEDSGVRTITFASLLGNDGKGPANESGQSLTITAVSNAIGGSVAIVSGQIEFTPDANFNGAASFDYTVQDNGTTNGSADSLTDTGHVSFAVTEVNDAPTATDDALSNVAEDSGVRIITFASLTGNDDKGASNESGQSLTITAVTNAIGGSVAIVSGQIEFAPDADFNGTASFDYTVQDNGTTDGSADPLTDTGHASFGVAAVNDAPAATDDSLSSSAEDSSVRIITFASLTGNDAPGPANESGQSLTITNVSNAIGGSVAIVSGQVEFTPDANFHGAASFDYIVQDSGTTNGSSDPLVDTGHVSFTVTEVNDAPTATDDALSSVAEDSGMRAISFASLLGNDSKGPADESGESLTITAVSNAVGGSVAIVSGQVEFTPDANHNGAASFDYTVQDDGTTNGSGDPSTDTDHVTFAVTEVNDAPTAGDDALSGSAEDSGTRILTFAALTGNDSKGPADESGQSLTITAVSNAIGGTVAIVSGQVEFTPDANFNGAASFDYTAQDDGVTNGSADPRTDTGHVSFAVTDVNDAPTATDDALSSGAEDSGARIITFASLTGNDSKGPANESGQSLTITAVTNAIGGTVAIVSGQIQFTPDANFHGAASFDYTVQDDGTTNGSADPLTGTGHVTFAVTEVNDAPTAADDSLSAVAEDSGQRTISFASLLGNDSKGPANESGQSLTITTVSNAVGGLVSISGTDVLFTPTADFSGTASFDYTVQDNGTTNGASDFKTDSGAVAFTVTAVNDAPSVFGPVTLAAIDENSAARTITQAELLTGVTDPDGPTLQAINLAIGVGGGTLLDNGNGTWNYTPDTDDDTSVSFAYAVTDSVAPAVAASASLDLLPVTSAIPVTLGTPGNDEFTATNTSERFEAREGIDTINFGFRLVDATMTWSGNQVFIDGPSSHTELVGFERFVFTDGTVDNADANRLVDDLFYYSQNHDVWNAHADADQHYALAGWHEGRDPSAFFSTSFYLSLNQDVKAVGANPLTHFDQFGWKEGRAPSMAFDDAKYLAANPDVAAANIDPLAHFLATGAQEGRQPFALTQLLTADGFDYVHYLQQNPDVAAAGVDPLWHFRAVGWTEGRDPNALFDTKGYLATYTDVAAANINPFDHYNIAGWHEGRDPSVGFDTAAYLAANPDVAAAHVNPLSHYLHSGQLEGRSPQADGLWA